MDLVYILYGIWILLPITLFTLALWSKLETLSSKAPRAEVGDFLRQGVFTAVCAAIAITFDRLFLDSIVDATIGDLLPIGVWRFMVFPIVLLVAAKLFGGSKQIRIEKVTHSSARRKNGSSNRSR